MRPPLKFVVPSEVVDADLTAPEFRVFAHLVRRCGDGSECWPGLLSIAAKCHLSRATVVDAIKVLESKGMVVVRGEAGGVNRYRAMQSGWTSLNESRVASVDGTGTSLNESRVDDLAPVQNRAGSRSKRGPGTRPNEGPRLSADRRRKVDESAGVTKKGSAGNKGVTLSTKLRSIKTQSDRAPGITGLYRPQTNKNHGFTIFPHRDSDSSRVICHSIAMFRRGFL
jgi:hypothetical protein